MLCSQQCCMSDIEWDRQCMTMLTTTSDTHLDMLTRSCHYKSSQSNSLCIVHYCSKECTYCMARGSQYNIYHWDNLLVDIAEHILRFMMDQYTSKTLSYMLSICQNLYIMSIHCYNLYIALYLLRYMLMQGIENNMSHCRQIVSNIDQVHRQSLH